MGDLIASWHLSGAEEQTWRMAASQFRLPYWDWAQKQVYWKNFAIPQVCTLEDIDVILPGNQTKTIPNPLVGFTNPTQVPMGDPSMGPNAIKDDTDVPSGWAPLPVSVLQNFTRRVLTLSSGANASVRADTAFFQTYRLKNGSTESITGKKPMLPWQIHPGMDREVVLSPTLFPACSRQATSTPGRRSHPPYITIQAKPQTSCQSNSFTILSMYVEP